MPESGTAVRLQGSADLATLHRRYYNDPCIRERMSEFLGGTDLEHATAMYITGSDGYSDYFLRSLPRELPEYLAGALEVDRSLWDRKSLIADIDLEYHNFDYPAAAWIDCERTFAFQQPVLEATRKVLAEVGIAPLVLVSGRGFHFVWAVRRTSRAFHRLSALGRIPASLQARYMKACAPDGSAVDLRLGCAFSGLGMLMEFVGHRVLAALRNTCEIPVQLTAIEVGPGVHGREIVSFDLSEYGDPFHTRHIRLPFSAYLKPRQLEWALGEAEVLRLLPMFEIPLIARTLAEAVRAMHDPEAVVELARQAPVQIPDSSESMGLLLNQYEQSQLAAFHQRFYDDIGGIAPASTPEPPCARFLFEHPNDWLLRPAALQHVVRVLLALGWSTSAIAQRIYLSYLADCDWGDTWVRLDPCNRALFYARLFAGMIATGLDGLVDFNCVSHREKGYCTTAECQSDLRNYRDLLVNRDNRT